MNELQGCKSESWLTVCSPEPESPAFAPSPPFYSVPFATGGIATIPSPMLFRKARGNDGRGTRRIGGRNRKKKDDGTVQGAIQGNWKFLLPFRFHFTSNHATVACFIQRALTRFAIETSLSLQVNTLNDAVGGRK